MARVCSKRGVVLTAAIVAGLCGLNSGAQADQVRVVAKAGDLVPGGNGQSVSLSRFSGFTNAAFPQVSNSGHVLFTAEVTGTGVITSNNRGLWRANPDGTFSLVARLGTGAWSPSTNLTFSGLASPMVNADGMCAFMGTLAGTGVTTSNSRSYWCFQNGPAQLLVREAEDAVGFGSGVDLGTITEPEWIRSNLGGGLLIFKSTLSGSGVTTTNNRALWVDGVGSNNSVALARAGYTIEEFPTLTCKEPYRVTNRNGQAVLFATLMGTGIVTAPTSGSPVVPNDQIIWAADASQPIARAGDLAPGAASGTRFASLFTTATTIRRPQLNAGGHVLFAPTLCDSGGVAVGSGLWTNRSGRVACVIKSGDPAPGLSGVTISTPIASVTASSFAYSLADNGAVVFASMLQGTGVSFGSDRAIFRSNPDGSLQLLARGGDQVEGVPVGTVIANSSIARCWRVNANGEIAFVATLAGTGVTDANDVAIFVTINGNLRMVAREGDPIPESGGWRFSAAYAEPLIYFNARGQMLFPCGASGGSSGAGSTTGWFRVDETGAVRALVLGSEILPTHTEPALRMTSMLPTSPLSFSDDGEVVFWNNLMPGSTVGGASVYGDAVVAITIQPASTGLATGACCTGTLCSVTASTACTGSYKGSGTACDSVGNPVTCCPANFNRAGGVDVQDLFDFLAAYFGQLSSADANGSGTVTVEDVFVYLQTFFAGCS